MTHEQRMVKFFTTPASYPHSVGTIERRETHVSHVFLAGASVYKLKKAVRFPFVDASTLALRRTWCRLELRLNRRLAPALYEGMVSVTETPAGLRLGGRGRIVEWVVKMKRLPEDRMMDRLVAARRVGPGAIRDVARQLARFFARAARSRAIDRYGAPVQVAELVLGNLRECAPFVGSLFSGADRAFLESAYRQFLALHESLLSQRVRQRRIIDGHGDLRCENICLTDPATIFDCVEFQPAFRCGDMLNDLSFLVMDLECRGRADLADVLARAYQRAMRDSDAAALLPFYKCHRALVRGKVRGLAWQQHPATVEGRRLRGLARRHFALAKTYARQFAPPRLVVVGGAVGTGKSTVAGWLAERLGAVWLRTDEIRLTEFAHHRRTGQGFGEGLYAPRVSELVYRRLLQRAKPLIAEGRSVVCDGMFSKSEGRAALRALAARHGASFHFLECRAPRAVALRRIAARASAGTDLSEARPEHYERLRAGFEPVRGWLASAWTPLAGGAAPAAVRRQALAALRRAWRMFP